jgi:hypothetical protein
MSGLYVTGMGGGNSCPEAAKSSQPLVPIWDCQLGVATGAEGELNAYASYGA